MAYCPQWQTKMRICAEVGEIKCCVLAVLTSNLQRLACDAVCNAQITVARGQLLLVASFLLS